MCNCFSKNLGLGEGAPVIGSPFPWPHAKMPNELYPSMAGMVFLKSNGASFSGTLYPQLALAYPGLKLADLRGEFIRGWDDGRGIDTGRTLLTLQEATWIQPNIENNSSQTGIVTGNGEREFNTDVVGGVSSMSGVSNTGPRKRHYIRPRNVAFNYIVRAA